MKNVSDENKVKVVLNGVIVKTPKINTRSTNLLHGVKDTTNGKIYIYVPSHNMNVCGIYEVDKQDFTNNIVYLGKRVKSWEDIKKDVLKKYANNRKFIFVVNDENYIYCKTITIKNALSNPFLWVQKSQNNGKNNRLGLCFRALNDIKTLLNDMELQGIVETVLCEKICDIQAHLKDILNNNNTYVNNGYVGEFLISNNIIDLLGDYTSKRMTKKYDAFLNVISKNGKKYKIAVEIKTSLNIDLLGLYKNKTKSNTNSIFVLKND